MHRGIRFKELHKTFSNKRNFSYSHTGFKGSWLTLFLSRLNTKLYGISLKALNDYDHFNILNMKKTIKTSYIDINNYKKTYAQITKINPDFIFHLAAATFGERVICKSHKYLVYKCDWNFKCFKIFTFMQKP